MTTPTLLVIVVALVLVVGIVIMLARQGHPEEAATHPEETESGGPTPGDYPTGSRPAGPGAEGMNAPEPGFVSPDDSPRTDPD